MLDLTKLPTPNQFGDYWFGDPSGAPAIFSTKNAKAGGKFFACFGETGEVLFDGTKIRYFSTPDEALGAMRDEKVKKDLLTDLKEMRHRAKVKRGRSSTN